MTPRGTDNKDNFKRLVADELNISPESIPKNRKVYDKKSESFSKQAAYAIVGFRLRSSMPDETAPANAEKAAEQGEKEDDVKDDEEEDGVESELDLVEVDDEPAAASASAREEGRGVGLGRVCAAAQEPAP